MVVDELLADAVLIERSRFESKMNQLKDLKSKVEDLEKYKGVSSKDSNGLSHTGICVPIAIPIVRLFYLLVLIPFWIVVKKFYNEIWDMLNTYQPTDEAT